MKKNGSYEKLQKHKAIFIEKDEWENPLKKSQLKQDFEKSCKKRLGALLFMVIGGNFSRGSNFENLSTLTNIIFGIPFLNIKHPKVLRKKLDLKFDLSKDASRKSE